MAYRPVVLIIFDGWGVAPPNPGNAITQAVLPHFTEYLKHYPALTLHASGTEVGLLFGEIGNSEVGHLNIGTGRVYYQSGPRINQAISDGSFYENRALQGAITHVKKNNSRLHLLGLLSSGNVHASREHLAALLELAQRAKLSRESLAVHVILDGRDCPYNSGERLVRELEETMKKLGVGRIASLTGRWFALDRDNRWERIEAAYRAIVEGKGERAADSAAAAIASAYGEKIYDEEFPPTVITKGGEPLAPIRPGDAVIFFNFRPDRARELTKAIVLPGFDKFSRRYLSNLYFVTLLEYERDLPVAVAFAPVVIRQCLAEVVSAAGLKQFHIGETEKYAHVTYFLNGMIEDPFPGEERALVPSPRVANYAATPEMSAAGIAREVIKRLGKNQHDLIIVNFANADMVGHTGDLAATVKSVAAADRALGDLVDHTLAQGGVAVITADHGNAEEVINLQTGEIDKEHSTNPVPFIVVGKDFQGIAGPAGDPPEGDLSLLPPAGVLADVAPTVLKLLGLPQPEEMTGRALI
ncbi:MAG: 2,3-bisphosphoglycerate-independent phosphoglycerate mutase [Candidatus Magasanikbacteria bacterium]|nr:2,3-bisphosphoglycerate-independent phosphoglycerate mutase [Candidatus Magasanikbacteria bacterium]